MAQYDMKKLQYIGEGGEGVVYRIDSTRCIKYYKKTKSYYRELQALKKGSSDWRFPVLYDAGRHFIIREYIDGIPLSDYLARNKLTINICQQLFEIIETFRRLKFKRYDTRLDHLIITKSGEIRIIDPTNAIHDKCKHPRRMLAGLDKLGMKDTFLNYVESINPKLAESWK